MQRGHDRVIGRWWRTFEVMRRDIQLVVDVDGRIVLATVGGGRVVEVGGELFGLCVYYGCDEGEKHASIEVSDRRAAVEVEGAHQRRQLFANMKVRA